MSNSRTLPPRRARGSRTPRLVGAGLAVLLAGGVLGGYLSTAHAQHRVTAKHRHPRPSPPALKVIGVQTVGIIDFGPYDDGDRWQKDADDHPLMFTERGGTVEFIRIPRRALSSGTPEWTVNQMSDGTEVFIYVPTGKCLSPLGTRRLQLTHCDLASSQRWRPLNPSAVRGQPIAHYANMRTGTCLTAPRVPGRAKLARCGTARAKTQEIAFWWNA